MDSATSVQFIEGHSEVLEEDLMPFVDERTEEEYIDNYDEPVYFFKGAVFGLFFCLPFWIILFWLIF
ncbi:MAG: hypothetical protein LJE66_13920 [Desulfobacterales bacterium]|jgi:hypothetical protein|nr:hypothetical protein [Desulfobacterales bacterium]